MEYLNKYPTRTHKGEDAIPATHAAEHWWRGMCDRIDFVSTTVSDLGPLDIYDWDYEEGPHGGLDSSFWHDDGAMSPLVRSCQVFGGG